jgi:hypothetical protein
MSVDTSLRTTNMTATGQAAPNETPPPRRKLALATLVPARRPSFLEWVWFALQLLAIAAVELGDDIFRGDIDPPNAREAIQHAQQVAHFEQAHGFFIEPAIQFWFRQGHALFGLLSYATVVQVTNTIYALAQTLVPIALAIWIYLAHRSHFPLVRNITLFSTVLALAVYELFPLAPPRLTTGLIYNHHAFRFQDTVQSVIGDGKLSGAPISYNAYSAMPSLHVAWALIVAGSVILFAHSLLPRLLAGLYPILMLFTVVVSANHYLLDAAGAALVVAVAAVIALLLELGRTHLHRARSEFRSESAANPPYALLAITTTQPVAIEKRKHHSYLKCG